MATATLAPAAQIPAVPTQRDPEAVRAHVRQLHEDGGSYNRIAAAAGLDSRTVRDLISGRRPVTPYTTTVLLAVTTATLPRNRVDAGGTRLRLRALHVMGHGSPRIARAVGASAKTIRRLVRGDTTTITPQLRNAITGNWCAAAALDDDQLDTPGYRPCSGWKPATGTGIAPDFYPPALQQRRRMCPTTNA